MNNNPGALPSLHDVRYRKQRCTRRVWIILSGALTIAVTAASSAQVNPAEPMMTPIMLPLDPSITPPPATPRSIPPTPGAVTPAQAPGMVASSTQTSTPPSPAPLPGVPSPTETTSLLQSTTAGKLPLPTQMHGSVILAGRLYIFGGETSPGGWSNQAFSAPILPGGKLGSWRKETSLPEYRAYIINAVQAAANSIYIVGGLKLDSPTSDEDVAPGATDVLWTTVDASGALAPWKKSESFLPPNGAYNLATAVSGRRLYVAGGARQGQVSRAVYALDLGEDGSPNNPRQVAELPVSLWYHGTGVVDDRLFVWGGLMGTANVSINPNVYSSEIREDGSIGSWEQETRMPNGTYSSAFCVAGSRLYGIGGRYQGGHYMSDVWSAPVVAGQLGNWQVRASDLESQVYHSCAIEPSQNLIFVIGGRQKTAPTAGTDGYMDIVRVFSPLNWNE